MRNTFFGHKLLLGIVMLLISISSAYGRNVVKNLPTFDNDPLNFGFTLGITYMNFASASNGISITNDAGAEEVWYSDISSPTPGFHVGIISSLKIDRYFNLRVIPTISLGQRNLSFYNSTTGEYRDEPVAVKSTFIEVPMLIKYKAARDGNARAYLIGGINPRYDLARSRKDDILLKPFDLYFELGVGSDFYLQFFRFGVEVKFCVGLNDMLERDRSSDLQVDSKYTKSIDKLTSRLFVISLNFE